MEEKEKKLAKVYHVDLYGKRTDKFDELSSKRGVSDIEWDELDYREPDYFFVPKDFELSNEYLNCIAIEKLFLKASSGIETQKDNITINYELKEIKKVIEDFRTLKEEVFLKKYEISNSRDWKFKLAREDASNGNYVRINYRPFDSRYTFYTGKSKGFMANPRHEIMKNLVDRDNLALQVTSKNRQLSTGYVFLAKNISDRHLLDSGVSKYFCVNGIFTI